MAICIAEERHFIRALFLAERPRILTAERHGGSSMPEHEIQQRQVSADVERIMKGMQRTLPTDYVDDRVFCIFVCKTRPLLRAALPAPLGIPHLEMGFLEQGDRVQLLFFAMPDRYQRRLECLCLRMHDWVMNAIHATPVMLPAVPSAVDVQWRLEAAPSQLP